MEEPLHVQKYQMGTDLVLNHPLHRIHFSKSVPDKFFVCALWLCKKEGLDRFTGKKKCIGMLLAQGSKLHVAVGNGGIEDLHYLHWGDRDGCY